MGFPNKRKNSKINTDNASLSTSCINILNSENPIHIYENLKLILISWHFVNIK